MKYLKLWENFNKPMNESAYDDVPVGTKVKTSMGIRQSGVVIPWFNWRSATDGTYSEPDRENYVAIQFDDGDKGFSAVSNLIIIGEDGKEEPMGRFISDEEYDRTGDSFEVNLASNQIEFEEGSVDNFIIYDNGKIAFDNWYPEEKYNKLVDAISLKISQDEEY